MKKINWKVIAIMLLTILIIENILIIWGAYSLQQEEKKTYECFYEVCEGYIDAEYVDKICTCYEEDVLGGYAIGKQKYIS